MGGKKREVQSQETTSRLKSKSGSGHLATASFSPHPPSLALQKDYPFFFLLEGASTKGLDNTFKTEAVSIQAGRLF